MRPRPALGRVGLCCVFVAAVLASCTDDPTTPTPPPVAVVTINPDNLSLLAGTTFPLAVAALDSSGKAVGTLPVSWRSSNASVASVSDSGVVTALTVGTAAVTATISGITGTATIVVRPGVASVQVVANPGTIQIGQRLALSAKAFDASGIVVPDATIEWSSSPSSVATIALDGTLTGVAPGIATITATSNDKSGSVTVTVAGDVTVTILEPVNDLFVADSTVVIATVTSAFQLAAVEASIGTTRVPLHFSTTLPNLSDGRGWVGTISTARLPFGSLPLLVTATDVRDSAGVSSVQVRHDAPPTISIVSPQPYDVTSGTVRFQLSCADPDATPCIRLSVAAGLGYPEVARGVSTIDQVVSLAALDGQDVSLNIAATDAAGQETRIFRSLSVLSSPNLHVIATVPGLATDVQGARILFADTIGGRDALRIRAPGTPDVTVLDSATMRVAAAFLTPAGAIYITHPDVSTSLDYALRDFRGGTTVDLGSPVDQFMLVTEYAFAVRGKPYSVTSPSPYGPLLVRDLTTGTNTTLGTNAARNDFDVTIDGHVAYWTSDYQIVLDATQLTHDASLWNVFPLTDGSRVVFTRTTPCCTNVTSQIVLHTGAGEVALTPMTPRQAPGPRPGVDYQVNNGWVAYTKPDIGGVLQLWIYSPTGMDRQASTFGESSAIEALGANGEVVFSASQQRYVAVPPYSMVTPLGKTLGRVLWRDGRFVILVAGTVFEASY